MPNMLDSEYYRAAVGDRDALLKTRAALLADCESAQTRFPEEDARRSFDEKMEQIDEIDRKLQHATNVVRDLETDTFTPMAVGEKRRAGDVTQIRLMAEALSARFGGPAPSNDAREFMHLRAVDLARHCLEQRGIPTRAMAPHQIVTRALHTTSDFPSLLAESGNRTLRAAYESYQGGVRRICKETTAPDFRAKSRLMLGEGPALVLVPEHGEVTRGSMSEAKASYALATYARIFGITRQALVNDDLGAFMDLSTRLGRAAAEFIATQLAARLTDNALMADGVALLDAGHGNLGTPAVISIASLGEALSMMRLQTGLDGVTPIDVTPKFLVVPAALEVVAKQYVAQITAATSANANPFTGTLDVVVDPRLDADDDKTWYLAADPATIDTIEYAYLESEPGPQIESRAGFDVEGVEMKVRLDFGSGVIDHRGLFKNAGA